MLTLLGSDKKLKEIKPIDLKTEGEGLLAMDRKSASAIFRSYPIERQLAIIEATRDPKKREYLYYLVPDCTELVQKSKTEDILQILHTKLGTGLTCGLLPAVSPQQFEEIIDITVWRDGKLNEETLSLWIGELAECEQEDLKRLLPQVDVRIVSEMFRGKVELSNIPISDDGSNPNSYRGLFAEAGIIDLSAIEYADEQTKFIMEAIYAADSDYFEQLVYEIFAKEEEDKERDFQLAKEERGERQRKRDEEAGFDFSEEEIFEEVDLENLDLEDLTQDPNET